MSYYHVSKGNSLYICTRRYLRRGEEWSLDDTDVSPQDACRVWQFWFDDSGKLKVKRIWTGRNTEMRKILTIEDVVKSLGPAAAERWMEILNDSALARLKRFLKCKQ